MNLWQGVPAYKFKIIPIIIGRGTPKGWAAWLLLPPHHHKTEIQKTDFVSFT
jgi:hypothetical protein